MAKLKASKRSITDPVGFYAAGATCGIKASGLPDLALIVADRPCAAAGVFTRSRTIGAPLVVSKRHLRAGQAQAVVVNSGNANASTGKAGERDAKAMCKHVADELAHNMLTTMRDVSLKPSDVLVASTGIIGHPLPMDRIGRGIASLVTRLGRNEQADADAARAIMTTDLAPKAAHARLTLAGKTVRLAGIAKGSGMIAPNMGTMLAFITTDADIAPAALQQALTGAADASFNRISVDQHTSPSDMALVLASGAAGHDRISRTTGDDYRAFADTLTELCRNLAYQIVQDGEGATRVFRVNITHARNEREADRVAKAIVDSPLVKCAVHGGDPNWGRIVTAAGYSGVALQPAKMSLLIGDPDDKSICVYRAGTPTSLNGNEMRRLGALMRRREVVFNLALGRGEASVQWLGCDLSRQYVTINADYTT
ncbi:bifunctional glutamate N-acetyltransferase/amino-acid acetyltransferase ArgJ [Phycisphaerales bacterium AB-hyl4]|uniref:Arginine biosynthesis bifunctional protein ArgJ n=1 Tax=Natronomicrosphaera hydrolytica TaxID=3242702 RepID=A0ABV4U2B1_9BACT